VRGKEEDREHHRGDMGSDVGVGEEDHDEGGVVVVEDGDSKVQVVDRMVSGRGEGGCGCRLGAKWVVGCEAVPVDRATVRY
jgi:hypothetical protein